MECRINKRYKCVVISPTEGLYLVDYDKASNNEGYIAGIIDATNLEDIAYLIVYGLGLTYIEIFADILSLTPEEKELLTSYVLEVMIEEIEE